MSLPLNIFIKVKGNTILDSTITEIDGKKVITGGSNGGVESAIRYLSEIIPILEAKGYEVKYITNNSWPVYHFKKGKGTWW